MIHDSRIALTLGEAAAALGISRDSVRRAVKNGDLPSFKVGAITLIPRAALEQLVNGVPAVESLGGSPSQVSGGDGRPGQTCPNSPPGPAAISHVPNLGTETR